MAGVYIHVPFCKQLCYYCDFHFSLSLRFKDQMIASILQELELRKNYLPEKQISTIYFGGGTPSVLELSDIEVVLAKVHSLFSVNKDAEITLEANPDDLSNEYLFGLKQLGINRLSIGIQSFIEEELKLMNRRHTADEGSASVFRALEIGFSNITVDLIYGLPNSTIDSWTFSLESALKLPVDHFSCYHLGVEEKTAFANFKRKGKIKEVDEGNSWEQYELLCQRMREEGYEHYEISNFCKPNRESRHNSSYWNAVPYLGIGPSAHSFDGANRQWNLSHNLRYMEAISRGTSFSEREDLSPSERYNDYLITHLRTSKGIDFNIIKSSFPEFFPELKGGILKYTNSDLATETVDSFKLTEKGMFQSDAIISDLFHVVE